MKVLFVHKQILFPRDTGGKIRVLNILKHLGRWHEVTYVSNLRPGEERHLPEMEALGLRLETVTGTTSKRGGVRFYAAALANLASRYPFTVNRNYDPAVREKIARLLAAERYDVLVCDTMAMARHVMGLPNLLPSVLFQHNFEALLLQRHADTAPDPFRRAFMRSEYRKMVRFEGECCRAFDAVVAVSEPDKALFEKEYGVNNVLAIDTAVDEEFFHNTTPEMEIPGRVAFVGSMDWLPNQDGVRWFVQEAWPAVRQARPDATFHLVGRNPPAEVRALGGVPGVTVVGGVPDVRPHLAEAAAVVVPLLVGGGTRLKIYEAMAMARAVVSTTIGAEGLPVVPGEHYLAADEPKVFADAVVKLLADAEYRSRVGTAADAFVRRHYASEPVARQFEAICQGVVEKAGAKKVGAGV